MWFEFAIAFDGVAESFAIKLVSGSCSWYDLRFFLYDTYGLDFEECDFAFLGLQDIFPYDVDPRNLFQCKNGEISPYVG